VSVAHDGISQRQSVTLVCAEAASARLLSHDFLQATIT
jgi:hypothetical protein